MGNDSAGVGFPSSHWSLIARATGNDRESSQLAMEDLCQRYWYSLYAFIRRQVPTATEAEDVTQGFFAHLLEREVIASADRERGRFRCYLLSCCRNFLENHRRRQRTIKHGGQATVLSFDFGNAATRYAMEPGDPVDAEALFLRRWAYTLIEETFTSLEDAYRKKGQADLLTRLKSALTGDIDAQPYAEIGKELNRSENAIKLAAKVLRKDFGTELRRRISETVDRPEEVADEIRDLFSSLQ